MAAPIRNTASRRASTPSYAWHSLFIRQLLIRPERAELAGFVPDMTIIDLPSFKPDAKRHGGREGSDTMVAIDFTRKIVLICGSSYAGEMKKSVFTTLNFYLPAQGVMPMHCSANVGKDGDSALFFGLSGTGKTTLSADPNRTLIGDDETGWSPDGIFNFEGGCYAKTIKLSQEAEPKIWDATNRFGAVLENVVFDPETRIPDYDSDKLRPRTPARPIRSTSSRTRRAPACAGHPKNIIFLTADAYGVMPPIAKLTPAQAMYHFLSGYTAKVAGTEKGLVGVEPEFSTCFGAPFLPRPPAEYGRPAARLHRQAQGRLLAGQLRLDRRHLRRRPPHADQGDARAGHRRARRLAEERAVPHRSVFRLRGADLGAGHRAASALSDQDLGGQERRSTRPRASSSACSRRTSPSTRARSTPRCAPPRRKCGSRRSNSGGAKRKGRPPGRPFGFFPGRDSHPYRVDEGSDRCSSPQ